MGSDVVANELCKGFYHSFSYSNNIRIKNICELNGAFSLYFLSLSLFILDQSVLETFFCFTLANKFLFLSFPNITNIPLTQDGYL